MRQDIVLQNITRQTIQMHRTPPTPGVADRVAPCGANLNHSGRGFATLDDRFYLAPGQAGICAITSGPKTEVSRARRNKGRNAPAGSLRM